MEIRRYLSTLSRWKWLIVLGAVTCGVTSALVSLQLPKQYASTAVALVSPKQVINPSSPTDTAQLPNVDQLVQTYIGLMNTDPVRQRMVQDGVPRNPDALQGHILLVRATDTTLITITITDQDPAVAQLIARDIVPAFNQSLNDLQARVPTNDPNSHLQALVAWELPSQPNPNPVYPNVPYNAMLALVAGLVLSVLLAFVLERIDTTIKTEADVGLQLGAPLLGTVRMRHDAGETLDGSNGLGSVIAATNLKNPISEQYRALRTNVMFSQLDKRLRTLMVTSALPGEGKTTTACNLAVVMAQTGHRVILVDADFRRPDLHRVFRLRGNLGLGNLILADGDEAGLIQPTEVPNLRLVCSGPTPPNPSELLGSGRMQRVLDRLATLADVVILDTPPVAAVTDATVLSTLVDGTILVVEEGGPPVKVVQKAISTLTAVRANLIGVVLNKADPSDDGAYSYYYGDVEPGANDAKRKWWGGRSKPAPRERLRPNPTTKAPS